MHVGYLGPRVGPEKLVQPAERLDGTFYRRTVTPAQPILGQVEHAHCNVFVPSFLIDVLRIERHGEVVDVPGVKPHTFSAGRDLDPRTPRPCSLLAALPELGSRERGAVPVSLVIDLQIRIGFSAFPPWISFNRHSGRTNHLVFCEIERHIVRPEFPVELSGRVKRVSLPAVPIIRNDSRIPLSEIESAASAALATGDSTRSSFPVHFHHHTLPREKGNGKRETGDG